jgi:hypothetical protein
VHQIRTYQGNCLNTGLDLVVRVPEGYSSGRGLFSHQRMTKQRNWRAVTPHVWKIPAVRTKRMRKEIR